MTRRLASSQPLTNIYIVNLIFRFAREVIFSSANLSSRFVILLLIHSIRQRSLAFGYAVAPDVAGRHKGDACLRSPQKLKFSGTPIRGFIASKQLFKVTYLILIQSRCSKRYSLVLCTTPDQPRLADSLNRLSRCR